MSKLQAALQLFDSYNQQDPRVLNNDGKSYPQEYFYALKLYDWIIKLDADASNELILASRCQHIGRWEIPRESYPEGRDAYLKWRKDLALHHAAVAGKLLMKAGYNDTDIERVVQIVLKKRIKVDTDVQTMENALCLVFLQYQYDDFRLKYENEPEKMINILYKSLLKMDAHGHHFALQLDYSAGGFRLVQQALVKMS
ncbi:DUF4202 domain-containing protein [Mucilaginibacter aquatilis]|uniref:DUF4202 family protein n=1 Tax=Mucilaginibacter aquatilis TaxID=1517760 RepID=A0A6I4I6X8_9SPHI|nr:DUF4202 domain-containing protein [Mucilaginibacter aquatilis]MVN90851.1 DUF4202 family protein [Mucilaginibacter aquatilis]